MKQWYQPDLLDNRVAAVVGGSGGVGYVVARSLAQVGARPVLLARREDALGQATSALADEGLDADWLPLDVRDDAAVESAFADIEDRFGSIDLLVNSAGGQFPSKAEAISAKGWRSVIDLNLNGLFYCCQAAGRRMIDAGGGAILNVGNSLIDRSTPGIAHSGAAKAGVSHLTRSLAHEWAPFGVRVNALGPQYLSDAAGEQYGAALRSAITRATPMGRYGSGDEIGAAAVYLLSELSGYTTGMTLHVDGGAWMAEGFNFRTMLEEM